MIMAKTPTDVSKDARRNRLARGRSLEWRQMLAIGFALAVQLGVSGCSQTAEAQSAPARQAVSVSPAVQRSVNDQEEFSGRIEAIEFVDLRPRVTGTIDRVHFTDGALVHKGDLLFTVDPRPFAAELSRTQALLTAANARKELAQQELTRARTLLDGHAASQQEVDQLDAGLRTAQADIEGATAALRVARLNLEYTQVRAPIDGRASRANITAGNLVSEQSVLTTIAGVSRVYAYFEASEQTFLRLRSMGSATAQPLVQMGLANELSYPHDGRLDFVDNRLNSQTGAIRMRATFDNNKGQFTPGLAARIRLQSPVPYDAVMVPERAIGTDQSKKYVYVVDASGNPQFREVKPGALFDGMRVVKGGVRPGENVVVDGLQRVMPGVPVAPQVLKVDANGMPILQSTAAAAAKS